MLRALTLAAVTALASCTPSGPGPETTRASTADIMATLPPARAFAGPPGGAQPVPANGQLARDFMALSFQLETGRALPVFTRFEGPITVAVEGSPPATLTRDLDALLDRLRREARLDITRAAPGTRGAITIAALPRATLEAHVPNAACFVVPRVSGWAEFLANRGGNTFDWTTLQTRSRASIFLPADVSAQEIRDCLHEELAQAIGPLNDLYRLSHSVFNDDNMQVVLTRFDMMILRATYDGALRSGMTQEQVAARLPAVLARINPRGARPDAAPVRPSPRAWTEAIEQALAARATPAARLAAATRALEVAESEALGPHRVALSQMALGRAAMQTRPDSAIAAMAEAGRLWRDTHGDGPHAAHVAVHMGAFALSTGQPDSALRILDRAIPAADEAQNAGLLSTLLLLRAEAMEMQGARSEAAGTRREGLAWGRYAWGDGTLTRRMAEVASLGPGA